MFFQTPTYYGEVKSGYQLALNIGVSAKFLKDQLRVTLEGVDLFRRSTAPNYSEAQYFNVYETRQVNSDSRKIKLSIRYVINTVRAKYSGAKDNENAKRASLDKD